MKIIFSNWLSALQRNQSLTIHKEIEPISPKQSLPASVQFRDFFAAKTPKRSFGGDNQFCRWQSALQRYRTVTVKHVVETISRKRTLLMRLHFRHSTVANTGKQSFGDGKRFF